MRQSIWKYSWIPACDSQLKNTLGNPHATVNLKILLDTRVRQWIIKYSWTPACDSQLKNTLGHPRATVNLKILLDTRVQQWIIKYSWTTACDSQFENTPRHLCDSHFSKGISALSWSFPFENWNKTNMYEMITHHTACQQCKPCQQCQQCQQL